MEVLAPIVVILIVRFAIAFFVWPDLATGLGNALGYIFIWYLLTVVIAATLWKVWHDRKHQVQAEPREQDGKQQ